MTEETQARLQLDLDKPRQVSLKTKNGTYLWHLRRVSCADWQKFFTSIINQTLQIDGEREQVIESEAAMIELVDRVVDSVEGYGDVSAVPNWKAALPLNHRAAVGLVLRNVAVEARPDAPQICDLVEISLGATWPTDGKSLMFSGLLHRFRHPSSDQLKRFKFESSRVKVQGTAENGRSIFPSRQAIAMKMYDDLIESVDGYSIGGQPLSGVEAICREMDGAHKAAAALALFTGDEAVEIE
jgi:hypothetical protein